MPRRPLPLIAWLRSPTGSATRTASPSSRATQPPGVSAAHDAQPSDAKRLIVLAREAETCCELLTAKFFGGFDNCPSEPVDQLAVA
jgi:hypothetical protein